MAVKIEDPLKKAYASADAAMQRKGIEPGGTRGLLMSGGVAPGTFKNQIADARSRQVMESTDPAAIANEITSQDSALMERARTRGRQVANQRGLLNSTIAGQAQEAAMMDFAVPLASQAADINSRLKAQGLEQEWRSTEAELERDLKMSLANMEIDQSNRRAAEEQIYRYHSLRQNTIANIMANPNLSSKERQRQIEAANATLKDQMGMVQGFMNVAIPWGEPGEPAYREPAAAPARSSGAGSSTSSSRRYVGQSGAAQRSGSMPMTLDNLRRLGLR